MSAKEGQQKYLEHKSQTLGAEKKEKEKRTFKFSRKMLNSRIQ